jgi:hypothetical protein
MGGFVDTVFNALADLVAGIARAVVEAVNGMLDALGSIAPAGWLPFIVIGLIVLGLVVLFRR